jgi:hypothetical protein
MQKRLIALALVLIAAGALLACTAVAADSPGPRGSVAFLSCILGFVAGYSAAFRHYRPRFRSDQQESGGKPGAAGSCGVVRHHSEMGGCPCPSGAVHMHQDGEDAIIELEGAGAREALWFAFFAAMNTPVILILWVGVACASILNSRAVDWDKFLAGAAVALAILAAVVFAGLVIFTLPGACARTVIAIGPHRLLAKRSGLLGSQTRKMRTADVRGIDVTMCGLVVRAREGSDLSIPTGRSRAEDEWLAREVRDLLRASAGKGAAGSARTS